MNGNNVTAFLSIEQVSRDPWMSGRIALEEKGNYLVIRKRAYPLAVFLCCISIFGGLYYWIAPHMDNDSIIMEGFYFMCPLMVATFTLIAWWINRKPSILVFDSTRETLIVPRYSDHTIPLKGAKIRVIPTWVEIGDLRYCQILTVCSEEREIAIFCEHSKTLKKPAQKFAERAGVKFEILPLRKTSTSN